MCQKKMFFIWMLILWVVSGCFRSDEIEKFKTFIESKEQYHNLVLEKIEYPRSVRTRLHSKEAGLGPEWDYVLMGRVDRQVDLRILVEAIYRMNLQDKICIEIDVGKKDNLKKGKEQ